MRWSLPCGFKASESTSAGVAAGLVMAIIPAHMMRSSAGEYDNEAVAAFGSAKAFQ